jgi:WD40 repeat protein
VLEEHSGAITGLALSEDGRWIFTSSTDGSARLWDVANAVCASVLYRGDSQLSAIAVSHDNSQLSVADTQRGGHLIDLDWELAAPGAAPLARAE